MGAAQVQTVREGDSETDKDKLFEIVTTETNEFIVREAIVAVSNDSLRIESSVEFLPRTNPAENNAPYFPILSKDLSENLHDANVPLADVREYLGGVGIVVDDLKPALTTANLTRRLEEMRLQPDFQHYAWRKFEVIGLKPAGTDVETGLPTFNSMAVVVTDPSATFDEGKSQWEAQLAQPELDLTKAALSTERTLRKVVQFAPQVASQTQQRAIMAMVLALTAVVIYIWVRFGTLKHGMGAVIALFHDIAVAMGAVAITSFLAYTAFGHGILLGDYKVNLTIMAAFLTLIGYSINDTIVVFDRIRENSGRLHDISPKIFNDSINQTMSRTLLTGVCSLLVTVVMYIWGGPGIQGFAYVMTIGTLVGTYSSFAVASPLLLIFANKGRDRANGASDLKKKLDKVNV
jgi:SecD/SecF fusion protein